LPSLHLSSCSLGCLMCSSQSKECQLCDFKSFYYKDNSTQTCKRSSLTNCLISYTPTHCIICKENYYPNQNGICTTSDNHPNPIKNCLNYYSVSGCAKCETNYYLSKNGKSCLQSKLQNKSGCVVFAESSCLVCSRGLVYDVQKQMCQSKFVMFLMSRRSKFRRALFVQEPETWLFCFRVFQC
jgi:hypothetical protein